MRDTIVLYPAPSPALHHVVSMVEFSKLILHHHHFSIIILITPSPSETTATTSYINRISQTHPPISFHHLPPLPLNTSPNQNPATLFIDSLRLHVPNILHALHTISLTSTIHAFVTSVVLQLMHHPNIPTYYYFTSGASSLASILYLPTIHKQTTKRLKDTPTIDLHLPGLPPIKASHMPKPLIDRHDPASNYFLNFAYHVPRSNGIIVNTFESFEPRAIEAIRGGAWVPHAPAPILYCIGPLIGDARDRAAESGGVASDCLNWLDAQPSRSVVFLCFGSRGTFTAAQVKEIAVGLERSERRFLWVLKKPTATGEENKDLDLDTILPEGFLDRTGDRGLVVESWAPQLEILSRESVGGFVSHCGWNSVMEAVSAGVPMVAWPLYAEQHLNKTVLVEELKLALPMEESEEGFVSAVEIEKRVRELMDSEEGRALGVRTQAVKERALSAWSESGSSMTAFTELVESWKPSGP